MQDKPISSQKGQIQGSRNMEKFRMVYGGKAWMGSQAKQMYPAFL